MPQTGPTSESARRRAHLQEPLRRVPSLSEARLWYDDYIAGLQFDVLRHVALVDNFLEIDADRHLLAAFGAYNFGAVARCVLPESADSQQGIQHRHAFAIWQRLRLDDLPDDLHLTEGAHGLAHDDVDLRWFHVLGQHFFNVARELRRSLANGDHVLNQWR